MSPTTLLLVRHADVHNPQNLIYGRLPRFRLSDLGRQEAARTAVALQLEPLDIAYTSPQLRARQTTQIILAGRPPIPVRQTRLLAEIYSSWEGVNPAQHGGHVSFYEPPRNPETDESIEMIWRRLERFSQLIQRRHAGQTVLAVSHGDPVRIFELGYRGGPFTVSALSRLRMPAKGSITRVIFAENGRPEFSYFDPGVRATAGVLWIGLMDASPGEIASSGSNPPLLKVAISPGEPTFAAPGVRFHAALAERETLISCRWGENLLAITTPHHVPLSLRRAGLAGGDINTGYLVRNVACHLRASGLVASMASVEERGSCHVIAAGRGYLETVFDEAPPLVAVELHGHNSQRALSDVEIATQNNPLSRPAELAVQLERFLDRLRRHPERFGYAGVNPQKLRISVGASSRNLLYYQGNGSLFLEWGIERAVATYQIECPLWVRRSGDRTEHSLPHAGAAFCLALAAALAETHPEAVIEMSEKTRKLISRRA